MPFDKHASNQVSSHTKTTSLGPNLGYTNEATATEYAQVQDIVPGVTFATFKIKERMDPLKQSRLLGLYWALLNQT